MSLRDGGLAMLLLLAGCATAPRPGAGRTTVESEGWAPSGPAAGERALADAQKRAVEKALGVSLAASTRVEGAVAVRRRIWTDARGKVESWTVKRDETRDGFRRITIRAVVRRLAEGEALLPPRRATVRVAASGPAAEGLRRSFAAGGFAVVERGGEFVVTARSSSRLLRDARTAPFVSGRGRVSVSVADSGGAVVWERAAEAAALDADALTASARAVEAAGEAGGRDAADGLSRELWNR